MELPTEPIIYTEILNKDSTFALVSYYWGHNNVNKGSIKKLTYGQQVERIIKDCRKHSVNYFFVRYPELEKPGTSYMGALSLKPKFIKYAMEQLPTLKCIFIDTDLRVNKFPEMFEADMDVWFLNWAEFDLNCYNPLQLELPGAILGFAQTKNAKSVLDIFIKRLNPKYAEDKTLSGIFTKHYLNIYTRCCWLPSSYLYMFDSHIYEPGKGYTKVSSYSEELKDTGLEKKDLVFVHEDFETGALDDIFKQRVTKNRYPPKTDKYLGEKLRCYNNKFIKYSNWGLNRRQAKENKLDWDEKVKSGIIKVKKLEKIKKVSYKIKESKINSECAFVIINKEIPKKIKESHSYISIECSSKINKAALLYKLMKKFDVSVCYTNNITSKGIKMIEESKNFDFITTNDNFEFYKSHCYDPKILKKDSDNIYYFKNNEFSKGFLKIWSEYHTIRKHSNRSLEYAFNVSNAINKLRCFWISSKYVSSEEKKYLKYGETGIKRLTKNMEVCGKKPERDTGRKEYYQRPSKSGVRGRVLYKKTFIE